MFVFLKLRMNFEVYFQKQNGGGLRRGAMCSVWEGGLEGEEGGRPPSITLPTNVTAAQSVGSGLALLDQVRLSA